MYNWVPPLKHIAAVRITVALYYDKDIEQTLELNVDQLFRISCFNRVKRDIFKFIENYAVLKLSFSLPESLKIEVSKLIRAIHLEVERWVLDHHVLLKLTKSECYLAFNRRLSWCLDGTIDRFRVAKEIIQDQNFDIKTRFELACIYFLEEEILSLWHGDKDENLNILFGETNFSVGFWMKHLKTGAWRRKSWKNVIEEYFDTADYQSWDPKVRMSCFFPFLSSEQKEICFSLLSSLTKFHYDDHMLCLQSLNEGEREKVYSVFPAVTLLHVLEWPLQGFAFEMAEKFKGYMNTDRSFGVFFHIIRQHILKGLDFFDYVGFLKEFYRIIPDFVKDELRKESFFETIEAALKYDHKSTRLSLPETLERYSYI